jgi:VWFA-related protein
MPRIVRFFFIAAALLFVCATGVSQEKNQPQTSPPKIEPPAVLKVTTRLVTVDVVARDRHGNAVRDLTAKEFEIAEQSGSHKSQQQIASFRLLDRSLKNASEPETAGLQLPAGVYTNLVSTKNLSSPPTILLVDGLNTDATTQLQVRQQMIRLLASAPSEVPMAVFLLGRELRLLQSFTTDTKLLHAAAQRALSLEGTNLQAKDARDDTLSHSSLLEQMAGAEGQSDVPGGAPQGNNSNALLARRALELQRFEREQYAESVDNRVRMTFDALRLIARHVSGYPGRKNLIWLSSAFPLAITPDANLTMVAKFSGMRNYGAEMTAVASALTDAQIAVYPVDPRGMQTQELFDAQSRGKANPFSEGATLNRESNVRFTTQDAMQSLARETGGKVCLNNNDLSECVKRAIDDSSSYYELSYYPNDRNWHGEFRRTSVKTLRSGVQLSYREGYFARESDDTIWAKDAKATDAHLSQAACNDFLTATSIFVEASALPPDQAGQTKYLLVIDPNAVSFGASDGGGQSVQMELATCMFNARGLPLQYNRQSLAEKFSENEYQSVKAHGISHTISFVPKPETARIRLLVCDTRTGMIGSVDLPYPGQIISVSALKPANGGNEPGNAAIQASPTPQASPHVIKFHGNEGRNGSLEWDAEKISYSGDMQPEASAKALFDSLWAKSYSCEGGKLVSVSDKTTPASQPLHFNADDLHGTEVYLDGKEGVRYSGNMAVDASVKPFFEALRSLYQCKNPG